MTVDIRRKNAVNLIRDKSKFSNFDEYPVLRTEVDPQFHVSLNSVDQPFFLVCQKDCVLAALTGNAQVHFHGSSIRYFDFGPGDYVYVPAGTPHRIVGASAALHVRYKAREPGLEAVAWHCESCGHELDRYTWDSGLQPAQAGYLAGTTRFNESKDRRVCSACGHEHEALDLAPFRWKDIAAALA